MFSRVIVIAILVTVMLAPGPEVRARALLEVRTPPSNVYNQAWGESARVRSQEPLAPYPLAERRHATAEHLPVKAAVASAEFGLADPTARIAGRTTRYSAEPIHSAAYGLPSATVATCTVTTRADSGPGSLRQCLLLAAANGIVLFNPTIFPPAAPMTITLASALPWIKTAGLTIDGSNAGVVLDGSRLTEGAGLVVSEVGNVTIRGLQVLGFPSDGIALIKGAHDCVIGGDRSIGAGPLGQGNLVSGNRDTGVWLQDAGTTGNRIVGNYLGTDMTGAKSLANETGVVILGSASGNLVGGGTLADRNLISGNVDGVWLEGPGTVNNRVQGNRIGTDLTGTRAISNTVDGVVMVSGAGNNLVGGDTLGAGNLISGNGRIGINLNEDCTGNRVLGNTIGADVSGTANLGNAEIGVLIGYGAHDNVVGSETAAARNLVSGNGLFGVLIKDAGTTGNLVMGNFIGTDVSGIVALGNGAGVLIGAGAQDNTIGGAASGAENLISGNADSGVWILDAGTTGNRVLGNLIGVDVTGASALSNGNDGITILSGAGGNFIGGDAPGAGNVISGNFDRGITIQGLGSDDNRVLGNVIGADMTGTKALGNSGGGIVIKAGASKNVIGGDMPGARNLISGNDDGNDATEDAGIWIEDANTADNRVVGNYIGTDVTGAVVLGNGDTGIGLGLGAHDTVIGGETPGASNVISGNGGHGVALQQAGTDGNRIIGNTIGLDATGTYSMTNGYEGVFIGFAASNNVVGGENAGARNLINGGVWLQDTGTTGNRVLGNYIGTNSKGTASPGNHGHGVALIDGPSGNVVGGEMPAARNVISGNAEHGVFMQGAGTTANEVKGNYIGTDVTGALSVGNGAAGISIIFGANLNLIGGNAAGARNLLSGNGWYGVQLQDPGTSGNRVQGNYIGTNANGTARIPNAKDGVVIANGASDNLIGGETPEERNLISGNGEIGVNLSRDATYAGDGATANRVLGNYIGTDVTGTQAVGNGQFGVHIGFGAYDNVVGGEKPGMRNIISGNASAGVLIKTLGTTGNSVLGNYIGTDVTGSRAVPNAMDGVAICFAASGNIVGGEAPGEGNLISGNGRTGVWMQNSGTTRNRVVGNTIGADASGTGHQGNPEGGVEFTLGSQGNVLGPNNSIVFNGLAGVVISGTTTLRNTITRNSIYQNDGLPIDFVDTPEPTGPVGLPALERYAPASRTLTGRACVGCRVEVFSNPDAQSAGTIYLGAATANATGVFTLTLSGLPPLPFMHATATDAQGTTSEFSSGLNANRARIYLPSVLR